MMDEAMRMKMADALRAGQMVKSLAGGGAMNPNDMAAMSQTAGRFRQGAGQPPTMVASQDAMPTGQPLGSLPMQAQPQGITPQNAADPNYFSLDRQRAMTKSGQFVP